MKRLLILGADGYGKVVLDVAESMRCYDEIHFLDDAKAINEEILGHKVVGKMADYMHLQMQYTDAAVAIEDNKKRMQYIKQLMLLGYQLPVLIHPTSSISPYCRIGKGTVVMPKAVLNAGALVGKGVIVKSSAIIEYDCEIADGVHIGDGAIVSEGVNVGKGAVVDIGVVIGRNEKVYDWQKVVIKEESPKVAMGFYRFIKRIIDLVLAIFGLICTSPIMLLVALIIKVEDPKGPVFFKQKRVGKDKKYFEIYKFRSMYTETPDIPTHLLTDPNQFITKTGKILRKTSLDEVPQLFNIIKGEMSFVGPRPALWSQFDLINLRDEVKANSVRPGITGLAQVMGRDELPLEEKAMYDGKYVEKISFMGDVKIFFKTIINVLKSEGVVEGGLRNLGSEKGKVEV